MPTKAAKKAAPKKGSKKAAPESLAADPAIHFAGYPATVVFAEPGGKGPTGKEFNGKKPLEQLLWGDYVSVEGPEQDGWVKVRTRRVREGWARRSGIRKERLLEVIFVDIGQGDGCLVVTPGDEHMLIDAGKGDNFVRFLRWRYPQFAKPRRFEAVVISHPDSDHYAGFRELFGEGCPNVDIGTVYHNGIVERAAAKEADTLGPRVREGGETYLTDVVRDQARLQELLSDPAASKKKAYPTMLKEALACRRVGDIRMLCEEDKHMPGYAPGENPSGVVVEVLGPVVERDAEGRARLRWFGERSKTGPTKNGHSVVLRLRYGNVSLLLGGDLNIPSEKLLLGHHTGGMSVPPATDEDRRLLVEAARKVFGVDVAKSCHHGSADFSELFLDAVNPIATVISSGDEEPHAHPRADTLGTIGKFSRGARPLIFGTELSRSASEAIKNPNKVRRQFLDARQKIDDARTPADREKALKAFEKLVGTINRSIGTYGAVNVRTDGQRVVIAYKIELATDKDRMWDIYKLEPESGVLRFKSKHEEDD